MKCVGEETFVLSLSRATFITLQCYYYYDILIRVLSIPELIISACDHQGTF